MTTTKPKPYIPRPWQLPHMLATPVGGKVLIVERCENPVEEDGDWIWFVLPDGSKLGQHNDDDVAKYRLAKAYCPLGPVGTVLACKERWAYLYRTADLMLDTFVYHAGASVANLEFVRWRTARSMPLRACRLFFRTTAIDLRRVDTMTGDEFIDWGAGIIETLPSGAHGVRSAEDRWLADNPGAAWGDWAWFITAKRMERC